MTAAAKESGQTLVEWARGALNNELRCTGVNPISSGTEVLGVREGGGSNGAARHRGAALPKMHAVNRPKSCDKASYVSRENPSTVLNTEMAKAIERGAATCVHGKPKGFNCWQCGGLAVLK